MSQRISIPVASLLLASLVLVSGCASRQAAVSQQAMAPACSAVSGHGVVVVGSGQPGDPAAPEPASGYRLGIQPVQAQSYIVATANPLATRAGCDVLRAGGSAVDAAVAVQMVLGLAEPQSSGIGGGAFLLYYDAATRTVQAYDGRETAPAAATTDYLRWVDASADQREPAPSVRASGRSIGTPGTLRMLELAHREHGRLPWAPLFDPAIALATQGFPVSARMAGALQGASASLRHDAEAAALYFHADGRPLALGEPFRNSAYARVLADVARQGADAFYTGPIAMGIVDKIRASASAQDGSPITPGLTTLDDLAGYRARVRTPVCRTYRAIYTLCSMPPPSSGGIAVASIMGILEHFDMASHAPAAGGADGALDGGVPSAMGAHLLAEAGRLAYADRDKYVADTDFVPLPGGSWNGLLAPAYLAQRAALIRPDRSMETAQAGNFGDVSLGVAQTPEAGTSHVTIGDAWGNVVSMTTTIESSMGSYHVTQGFVLNNELTDFAAQPVDAQGRPVANRVAAGKRPRSSMAPTMVFRTAPDGGIGDFILATGSPGGGAIIQYVAKTLVAMLDWGLDAQRAAAMANVGASNTPATNLGGEHPRVNASQDGRQDTLARALRALGHAGISMRAQPSGVATIQRVLRDGRPAWEAGVDPRREGLALGDGR